MLISLYKHLQLGFGFVGLTGPLENFTSDKNHQLVITSFGQTSDPEKFPAGLHSALITACCGLGPQAEQTAEGFPLDSCCIFHFTKSA